MHSLFVGIAIAVYFILIGKLLVLLYRGLKAVGFYTVVALLIPFVIIQNRCRRAIK